MKVGEKVIVQTCSGRYAGAVKEVTNWPFTEETAYRVSGPQIQTITKRVLTGVKEERMSQCYQCDAEECCFREEERTR